MQTATTSETSEMGSKRTTRLNDHPLNRPSPSTLDRSHTDKRGRRSSVRPDLYLDGLARDVGISAGYLSKLLRGIGRPSVTVAARLAIEMGVTMEELLVMLAEHKTTLSKAEQRSMRKLRAGN